MVLVFGGTTEGKKVAATLERLAIPFVYSTKTCIPFQKTTIGNYRHGALNESELETYLQENKITLIINAAHPFAELLHTTIAKVAKLLCISVIRFAQELLPKVSHPSVHYVVSYEKALHLIAPNSTLLALTGVQSIKRLQPFWQKNTTYFRILNRPESLAIAQESNFPKTQLILGLPSDNLANEISLLTKKGITVVLTKETGTSGFLATKIEAAIKTNCCIIIITAPRTPAYFELVYSTEELEHKLAKIWGL